MKILEASIKFRRKNVPIRGTTYIPESFYHFIRAARSAGSKEGWRNEGGASTGEGGGEGLKGPRKKRWTDEKGECRVKCSRI